MRSEVGPSATPCAFRLRELRCRPQLLASPVARSVPAGASIPRPAPASSEDEVDGPTAPGRLGSRTCYGSPGHRPRRLWLARSGVTAEWWSPSTNVEVERSETFDTLSRAAVTAAPSRSRPPRLCYVSRAARASAHDPLGRRCLSPTSATDSVVTSTQGNPRSRTPGLHRKDLRFGVRPFSPVALPARVRKAASTKASNGHEGIFDPSGAAFGTARAS
jgi:hypothetical protein